LSIIHFSAKVGEALADRRPVVALESSVLAQGLPIPANADAARRMTSAVEATGAVPAISAVVAGNAMFGLEEPDLARFLARDRVMKVSARDIPVAMLQGRDGATTVAGALSLIALTPIRVFATGGIGGVHRGAIDGARPSFDISADLDELARTPVAVVCAGPKSILDVPRTLEYLETRGVPVVSVGIDEVPGFYARRSGITAPSHVPDVGAAAAVVRAHRALGLVSGLVVGNPVPEADALPFEVARAAIERAVREADEAGIAGGAVTPWLLARVAEITGGASVKANISLITNNARIAGELARALRAPAGA
jgi:pseudouridine-5'-phosphate glycosidase